MTKSSVHVAEQDLCPYAFPFVNSRVDQPRNVDALLIDAVDQVLGDLLGSKTRDTVYAHLVTVYSLEVNNIPKNLQKFSRILEEVFGKSGKTVGYAICRKLFENLGWVFTEVEGFDFLDYVEGAKVKLAHKSVALSSTLLNDENVEGSGMPA